MGVDRDVTPQSVEEQAAAGTQPPATGAEALSETELDGVSAGYTGNLDWKPVPGDKPKSVIKPT